MTSKRAIRVACLAGLALAAGCGPSRQQVMMNKALSARADCAPTYNESARVLKPCLDRHDKDYALWSMEYCSLCLLGGNYDEARRELKDGCYKDITTRVDTKAEQRAAMNNESLKVFKGEPFERAMVCTYLGLIDYMKGDYNSARIWFTRADMETATKGEDMKAYRHDFQLGHYWLGRAYMKLGREDRARNAFRMAGEHVPIKNEAKELAIIQKAQDRERTKRVGLEQTCYKQATSGPKPVARAADASQCPSVGEMPNRLAGDGGSTANPVELSATTFPQFLTLDYQREVNLIIVIETGRGPVKFLTGQDGCMNGITRAPYPERQVLVYLDGHKAGPAFRMADLYAEAETRGTSEKDKIQRNKGITKAVLKQLPYISYAAKYWDVRADDRYWRLIPGEVHVFAAKVKPGTYTVTLQSFDANGYLLPRYSLTRYYIPVREEQDNVYLLHTKCEADNEYAENTK